MDYELNRTWKEVCSHFKILTLTKAAGNEKSKKPVTN